jgi:hypothetical protein
LGNHQSNETYIYVFNEGVTLEKKGNGILTIGGIDYIGTRDIATGAFEGFYQNDYHVEGPEKPLNKTLKKTDKSYPEAMFASGYLKKDLYQTDCDVQTIDMSSAGSVAYTILTRLNDNCLKKLISPVRLGYLGAMMGAIGTGSGEYDINKAIVRLLSNTPLESHQGTILDYLISQKVLFECIDKFSGTDLYDFTVLVNSWLYKYKTNYATKTNLTELSNALGSLANTNAAVMGISTGLFGNSNTAIIQDNLVSFSIYGKDYNNPIVTGSGGTTFPPLKLYEGKINATEYCYVYFENDFSIGSYDFKQGQTLILKNIKAE